MAREIADIAPRNPERGFAYELNGEIFEVRYGRDLLISRLGSLLVWLYNLRPYYPKSGRDATEKTPPNFTKKERKDYVDNLVTQRERRWGRDTSGDQVDPQNQNLEKFAAEGAVRCTSKFGNAEVFRLEVGGGSVEARVGD